MIINNGQILERPRISVSETGLITSIANRLKNTLQLPTKPSARVVPSTEDQVVADGQVFVTGQIVVAGDANLLPENIAEGVTIFGVTGTAKVQ